MFRAHRISPLFQDVSSDEEFYKRSKVGPGAARIQIKKL